MSSKRKTQNSKYSNKVKNELVHLSGNNNFSIYLSGNNYNSNMNSINHSDVLLRSEMSLILMKMITSYQKEQNKKKESMLRSISIYKEKLKWFIGYI